MACFTSEFFLHLDSKSLFVFLFCSLFLYYIKEYSGIIFEIIFKSDFRTSRFFSRHYIHLKAKPHIGIHTRNTLFFMRGRGLTQ